MRGSRTIRMVRHWSVASGDDAPSSPVNKAAPVPLAVRAAWGSLLLVFPGAVLRRMGGADEGVAPRRVMRVLGARHLVEAGAEWRLGYPARRVGIGVDAIHALTSLVFGVSDERWRRAAFTDALIAGAFVGLGLVN